MGRYGWLFALLVAVGCGKDAVVDEPDARCGPMIRCGVDVGPPEDDAGPSDDSGTPNHADADPAPDVADADPQPDAGDSCGRTLRPDGARKVVIGLPFNDPQTRYEVLDLSATGELSRPNVPFDMGRGADGAIQFTPDGEVGFARQNDGTIGVFRFNQAGLPEVIAAQHHPGFYVSGVLIDAAGDNLYAWETGFRKLDDGTANGALYRMPIACASGALGPAEEVLRGKLIRAAAWRSDTQLVIAAVDLLDDETPNDLHIVDVSGADATRVASASVFTHDDVVVSSLAITRDGQYVLLGDNSAFSGEPQGLGVVGIQGDQLFTQQFVQVDDPVSLLVSPHNNAALSADGFGDDLIALDYNPQAAASPISVRGSLAVADRVLLPGVAVSIDRGALDGVGLIAENVALRTVRFEANGDITDLGLFGVGGIPGALGVQP